MSPHSDSNKPQIQARIDPSLYTPNYVPGSRKAEEDAAIAAILERVPPGQRSRVLAALNDTTTFLGASSDPVIAEQLGVIASIRAADMRARAEIAKAKKTELLRDRIRIRIALVPSLDQPGTRAVVLRRPDDSGVPLLLLPEQGVTSADLARGLRAATLAQRRYGQRPSHAARLVLRNGRGGAVVAPNDAKAVALLAELRSRAPQAIPGVGTGRLMEILHRGTAPNDPR
jgi:hypothetical protein